VEVGEGTSATNQSDMGLSDQDTISFMFGIGRNSCIIMAGSQHIGVGNAKVPSPEENMWNVYVDKL